MDESNNVIKHGMDLAVPMALYTSVISIAWIYADKVPPLAFLVMVLLFAGPLALYFMQRRKFLDSGCVYSTGDLWRMGIVAIFFGTVFTLLLTYGVLQYVRSGYIYEQLELLLKTYQEIPELKNSDFVVAMQEIKDKDLVPSAWSYSLNMFVMTNFSGMFMALFTSMMAARTPGIRY